MGQQQLLLLVLGIVIVGLAVVVSIQSFTENKTKSEIDSYIGMGVEMAGNAIGWYKKPVAMGGGGESTANLASMTISSLGYDLEVTDTYNGDARIGTIENGIVRYVVGDASAPYFHIHPRPLQHGDTRVEVYIFGPRPECIVSRSSIWGPSPNWSDGSAEGTDPANPDAALCSW